MNLSYVVALHNWQRRRRFVLQTIILQKRNKNRMASSIRKIRRSSKIDGFHWLAIVKKIIYALILMLLTRYVLVDHRRLNQKNRKPNTKPQWKRRNTKLPVNINSNTVWKR